MAVQINQTTVTIPANTLKTALNTTTIKLPYLTVEAIDLEVPPGPSGLMGFYLALSGQQWIPYNSGEFIVWDNYRDSWHLEEQLVGVPWQVVGYNLDVAHGHEVVVRFHLNTTAPPAPMTPPTINIISTPLPQLVTTL